MPSRREFIQAGLAASVAPVALRIAGSADHDTEIVTPPHQRLYCVVCDVRSPASAALAREAGRLGARVVRTTGDITDFWFDDLSARWKRAPAAIAGLTADGPLFCLERFGWDHGLRVVFRGMHRFLETGHVEHALAGPFATVAAVRRVDLTGRDWAGQLARLLTACAVGRDTGSTTFRSATALGRPAGEHDALMSWVIAPKPV